MLLEAATRLQVLSEGHTVRSAISTMINGGSPFRSSSLAHTMEQPCRHTYSMAQRTRSGLCSLVVLASFLKNGSNRKYKQTTAKFKSEKKRALPGERERMIETEKAQGTSTCLSCTCNGRIGRPLWAAVIQRPIFSKAGLTLTRLLRKSRYNMIPGETPYSNRSVIFILTCIHGVHWYAPKI